MMGAVFLSGLLLLIGGLGFMALAGTLFRRSA